MVYKCSASGCKSGYDGHPKDNSVTFHSFPLRNDSLVKKWMLAISNRSFHPTKYSRLCSLHFQPEDFIQESSDTNVTRRRSMGSRKLILRRLKKGAYPTLLLPSGVQAVKEEPLESLEEPEQSPGSESLEGQHKELRASEEQPPEGELPNNPTSEPQSSELEFHFFGLGSDDSSDTTLSNISQFLKSWPVPTGFHVMSTQEQLVIYALSVNEGIPSIICSLAVTSDLRPIVSLAGNLVPAETFQDIIQGKVKKIVQVMDLLYRLESWLRSHPSA